jgi:DnaJ-class molecular chaperone
MGNLYDMIDAHPDDDDDRLKSAFRKAVRACHPDLHGGDSEASSRLRKIIRAYAILRDANKRADYDRWLELNRQRCQSKSTEIIVDTVFSTIAIFGVVVLLACAMGSAQ